MLELKNITKNYLVGNEQVKALKGISLKFRKSEFVSILGPSGCGKTTLLNIIGGLDKYSSGDLVINGVSTKYFTDKDWDTYRNHSIGFIFQSYHLIPHQTILQNVELALTIAGISKKERRKRAINALKKVGLGTRINNRPNQLSGGQAQRVAIARALVNNPDIILADEPTGALDSKTSVQIMKILKEISKDRLVIMVTHNPPLAEQYSTRIINVIDGVVVGDSKPYNVKIASKSKFELGKVKSGKKYSSMSIGMAMNLSFNNLISKGKRTALVSFAGSIGIIGVSLVLAISSGVTGYISDMENDMLSGYPIQIQKTALDFSSLTSLSSTVNETPDISKLGDKLYVNSLMSTLSSMSTSVTMNNISDAYVSYVNDMPSEYTNAITYDYGFDIANNIYTDFYVTGDERDSKTYNDEYASGTMSVNVIRQMYSSILSKVEDYSTFGTIISSISTFDEVMDNYEYVMSQYDVVAIEDGNGGVTQTYTDEQIKDIFTSKESLIMVVDDSAVTDLTMAQFGYFTQDEFLNYAYYYVQDDGDSLYNEELGLFGSYATGENNSNGLDYSYFIGDSAKKFTYYSNDSIYTNINDTWMYKSNVDAQTYQISGEYMGMTYTYDLQMDGVEKDENSVDLSVRLILQKKSSISYGVLDAGIYYTEAFTEHVLSASENSAIAKYINENGSLSSVPYYYRYTYVDDSSYVTAQDAYVLMDYGSSSLSMMYSYMTSGGSSFTEVTLSYVGANRTPSSIYIYPVDFDTKDDVTTYLDGWNTMCEAECEYEYTSLSSGQKESVTLSSVDSITYTDTVGLIISLINTMIEMITIALITFTSLSLVVSTVMIGIITYVSVVERIKEIGILRAVGARKKDIKRLFEAETFMVGLGAGIIGIGVTYGVSAIINIIVGTLSGIYTIAALPINQAIIMIVVSVVLTLISGLIPASSAANKDPVIALRTE